MKLGEAKLGVTIVLGHSECEKLGFNIDQDTKDIVREIKERLKNMAVTT